MKLRSVVIALWAAPVSFVVGPLVAASRTGSALLGVIAALVLQACGTPGHDQPDVLLSWSAHRTTYTVPDGGLGIVSNNGSDTLSILDLAAASTIGRVRVGIDPIANDGPHHVAVDPIAGHVFVALAYPPPGVPSGPHAGHGASTQPGWVQMLALDDFHEIARQPIDTNPGDIILTPNRRRVIVTHFDLQRAIDALSAGRPMTEAYATVWVLDATDLHRIASPATCIAPHGAMVTADSTRALVACAGQDSLAVIHLDDPALRTELIPVGPSPSIVPNQSYGPYSVLITQDQQYAIVGDLEGRDIRVFNLATNQFEAQHAIMTRAPTYFGAESTDGTMLYFPTQSPDQIIRIRRADWSIDRAQAVPGDQCQLPHEISRGPDGRFYMVCETVRNADGSPGTRTQPSHVVTFDPDTLAITNVFPVDAYPDRIVFVPTGGPR